MGGASRSLCVVLLLLAACGRLDFSAHDALSDAAPADGAIDAPSIVCPADYVALDATPRRYKVHTALLQWMDAAMSCAADGTHLFVPDDAPELAAVATYAGPIPTGTTVPDGSCWIGIDDLAIEGTYVTEAGAPAPYLPWATGQPDNFNGTEDCVHYKLDGTVNDLDCIGFMLPSVCECP